MTSSAETRRSFVSGISRLGFGLSLGSLVLMGGCGDEKGNMTQIENPENPAEKGKDSMNFYKSDNMKKAAPKKR